MPDRGLIRLWLVNVQLAINEGAVFALLPLQARAVGSSGMQLSFVLLTFSIATLASSPLWGWVSDRYGRRRPIQIALLANAAGMLMLTFADSPAMLGASRILGGIAMGAGVSTRAYAADISTQAQRARWLTFVDSAWPVGLSIGPLTAGLLANKAVVPGELFAALSVITLLAVGFRLPEAPRVTKPSHVVAPAVPSSGVVWVLLAFFLLMIGIACFRQAFVLHLADRFSYGPLEVGLLLAAHGIVMALTQVVAVPYVERRIGSESLLLVTLTLFVAGMMWLPLAQSQPAMACALVLEGVGGLVSISLAGVMVSRAAPTRAQGRALGFVQSVNALGMVTGFFIAGMAYDAYARSGPFAVGAIVGGIAVLLVYVGTRGRGSMR